MSILSGMGKIIVEDRTTETPQQALDREVLVAAQLIAGFTIHVSKARPPVGLGALTYVLGMGIARTRADVEEVVALLRKHYDGTREQMALEGTNTHVADEGADDEDEPDEETVDEETVDDSPKYDA